MTRSIPVDRSYLYAPMTNERILAKVFERGADAVVLDLEDSVAVGDKAAARAALRPFLDGVAADGAPGGPARVLVRVNWDGEGWSLDDLAVAVHPAVAAVSLPKAESAEAVEAVAKHLADLEAEAGLAVGTIGLHLLVESARGVESLESLARVDRVERFGLGAADLAVDLGILGTPHANALDHVRGRMVVASRGAGIGAPVDAVHTDIADLDGLRAAADRAKGFGFFGKSTIHPSQVDVVNQTFMPTGPELDWARRIVTAADGATGAFAIDGEMVDAPVLDRARVLLRLVGSDQESQP